MIPRRTRPGFTLLEVVLAVTLALGLLTAMFAFYRHTTRVRTAVTDEVERVAAVRAVMRLLTRELRSAFTVRFLGQGLDGAAGSVRLATITLPSGAVWIEQSVTEESRLPPERDVQIVGYRLRYAETEEGDIIVVGLERSCQRILTPREAEEGNQIEVSLLTPYVRFLNLQYWNGSAWTVAWQGDDLPQAVQIVLGHQPLPEDVEPEEYPYPTYRRVVTIPAAARGRSGTVIRGLEGAGGMGL
jgi:type II secretory pathway component PulJ